MIKGPVRAYTIWITSDCGIKITFVEPIRSVRRLNVTPGAAESIDKSLSMNRTVAYSDDVSTGNVTERANFSQCDQNRPFGFPPKPTRLIGTKSPVAAAPAGTASTSLAAQLANTMPVSR